MVLDASSTPEKQSLSLTDRVFRQERLILNLLRGGVLSILLPCTVHIVGIIKYFLNSNEQHQKLEQHILSHSDLLFMTPKLKSSYSLYGALTGSLAGFLNYLTFCVSTFCIPAHNLNMKITVSPS